MPTFYSVQSAADATRLAGGGQPWPTGLQRANLGIGFYAWDSRETAEQYLLVLLKHGATGLRIVTYEIPDTVLARLKTLDLTLLGDDEVTDFLTRYSQYGDGEPHDWEYIQRLTDKGKEHYFAASVFAQLREVP